MTGGMNGEEKSGTLVYLFILRAYAAIQDICEANSAQESEQCLLGSPLCVWVLVGEEIFVCCLSSLSLNLPLLIVALKIQTWRRISNTFKAISG